MYNRSIHCCEMSAIYYGSLKSSSQIKMRTLEVKKPSAIVMDVTGPLVTKSFMTYSQETREFLLAHYKEYVKEFWGRTSLRLAANFFRQELEAEKDHKFPPLADVKAPQEEQIASFLEHLQYRFEHAWHIRSAAIGIFHLGISDWGYKRGLLQTPVYEEVRDVLTRWKTVDGLKLYINVGPTNFLRNVFSRTTQGNLLPLIDGHMNLMENRVKNFAKLVQLLELHPQNILFITRMAADAKLAAKEKIKVVIIVREDFAPEAWATIKGLDKKQAKKEKERERRREERRLHKRELEISKSRLRTDDFNDSETMEIKSDLETITSGYDEEYEPGSTSRLNTKDVRDFPLILSLGELKWTS